MSSSDPFFQVRLTFSLLKRLGVVLIAFEVCRILFYLFNRNLFPWLSLKEFWTIFLYGIRFDLSSIAYVNAAFVLLATLPPARILSPWGRRILFIVFLIPNSLVQFFNCIDIIYYRFTLKRSTSDLLPLLVMAGDVPTLLPQFIREYWFIGLIWLGLIFFLGWGFQSLSFPHPPAQTRPAFHLFQSLLFGVLAGFLVLGMRGGFQSKPISLITASDMVGPRDVALVTNTPFTMITTLTKHYLEEKRYFSQEQLAQIYSPLRSYPSDQGQFRRLNVVIIVMESFGLEYMGPPFGNEGLTPFLDSLAKQGLFFVQAFANGKNSMQAIPAIVAGLPSLMPDPFISSAYSGNQVISLATLLGREGYRTAFYHGGRNGTMGFDAFCRVAGFHEYAGLNEYHLSEDYDGSWGVYDEPFFHYFAERLKQTPQPFFAAIFSLSSHHPYQLPARYQGKFTAGKHPLLKTIQYADYSLQRFFETAREMPWFQQTLFVITADHTAESFSPRYQSLVGQYRIPILFYCPSDPGWKGTSDLTTQQIDIMPTILDYLHYDRPFFSFGESALRPDRHGFAINFKDGVYQVLGEGWALQFNGHDSLALYHYLEDEDLNNNLVNDRNARARLTLMETLGKGFIQVYNHALLENRLNSNPAKARQ